MTNERMTSLNDVLRDLFPMPGTRLKQWVVDLREQAMWDLATCPVLRVPAHDDNTGLPCRNSGAAPWSALAHDCCRACNYLRDLHSGDLDVAAWQMRRAARPPICGDKGKLSDELEPPLSLGGLERAYRVLMTGKVVPR